MINRRIADGALLGRCRVAAPRRAGHVVIRDDRWTHRLQRPVGGVSPKWVEGGRRPKGEGEGEGEGRGGRNKEGVQQLKNLGSDALLNIPIRRVGCGRSGGQGVGRAQPEESLIHPGAQSRPASSLTSRSTLHLIHCCPLEAGSSGGHMSQKGRCQTSDSQFKTTQTGVNTLNQKPEPESAVVLSRYWI